MGSIESGDIDTNLVSKNGRSVRSRKNDDNIKIDLEKITSKKWLGTMKS